MSENDRIGLTYHLPSGPWTVTTPSPMICLNSCLMIFSISGVSSSEPTASVR